MTLKYVIESFESRSNGNCSDDTDSPIVFAEEQEENVLSVQVLILKMPLLLFESVTKKALSNGAVNEKRTPLDKFVVS